MNRNYSYKSNCGACVMKRIHTEVEKELYHPLAGHGYIKELGWTNKEAERLHHVERAKGQQAAK